MQHIEVNFGASTDDVFDVPRRLAVKRDGTEIARIELLALYSYQ
jgi:hypothetical protein